MLRRRAGGRGSRSQGLRGAGQLAPGRQVGEHRQPHRRFRAQVLRGSLADALRQRRRPNSGNRLLRTLRRRRRALRQRQVRRSHASLRRDGRSGQRPYRRQGAVDHREGRIAPRRAASGVLLCAGRVPPAGGLLKPILPATVAAAEQFLVAPIIDFDDARAALHNHTIQPFEPLLGRIDPKRIDAMIEASKESLGGAAAATDSQATPSKATSKSETMTDTATDATPSHHQHRRLRQARPAHRQGHRVRIRGWLGQAAALRAGRRPDGYPADLLRHPRRLRRAGKAWSVAT